MWFSFFTELEQERTRLWECADIELGQDKNNPWERENTGDF